MKHEITEQLKNVTVNVLAKAKETGLSYLEMQNLLKALQSLPKLPEENKPEDKDKAKAAPAQNGK
jgi:hypothetical protein